ncbi:MAG: thiamine phosphate synthase [Acidobacteriota bacterium]
MADREFLGSDRSWLAALERVATAAEGRPRLAIQLRVKELRGPGRTRLLRQGLEAACGAGVPVLLNGSLPEALDLGFDGVHWPEADVPASPPSPTPVSFWRVAAAHSLEAVHRAHTAGAHLAVFGPVYDPGSKPGRGVGLGALERIAERSPLPILAIGGIRAERVGDCLAAGSAGVAVVSAVFAAARPAAAIDALVAAFPA